MSPLILFISFFLYSFVGWILDTGFRTLYARKYTTGSFLPLPLCPIYGFGALIILYLHSLLGFLPLVVEGILFAVVLGTFEYVSGKLTFKLYKRRLWEYERTWYSVGTWTDAPHAIAWGILAVLLVYWIHPFLLTFLPI